MKQEERRRQTQLQLLNAVRELIAEKGCESLKMTDIMERSGLSKGAIFHYVKSKDELFALVLKARLDEIHSRFTAATTGSKQPGFEAPFAEIARNLPQLEDPRDITNQVLTYLLGKSEQPVVAQALQDFYGQWVELSREWIASGQRHGVIPASISADRTAELFVLVSLGLRVRSTAVQAGSFAFTATDFAAFVHGTLQSPSAAPKIGETEDV